MAELTLTISEKALESITEAAVLAVPGTTKVNRSVSRNLPKVDVQLNPESQTASVEVFIGVLWPSPVTQVSNAVAETIRQWLQDFAGVNAKKVKVVVDELVRGNRVHSSQQVSAPITIKAQPPANSRSVSPVEVHVPDHADWKTARKPEITGTIASQELRKVRNDQEVPGGLQTKELTPVTRNDIGQFAKEPQIRKRRYPTPKVGIQGTPSWKKTTTPHILLTEYSTSVVQPRIRRTSNKWDHQAPRAPRRLATQWSRSVQQPRANHIPVREVRAPRPAPLREIHLRKMRTLEHTGDLVKNQNHQPKVQASKVKEVGRG